MSLAELNRTSASVGEWQVRILFGEVEEYEYTVAGKQRYGMKFECVLASTDPTCYCVGAWKMVAGDKKGVQQAAAKFKDGTPWTMSRVSLDTQAKRQYISASHKVVVNLAKTTMTPVLQSLRSGIAAELEPPSSVAETLQLQSRQLFDITALVIGVRGEAQVQTKFGPRERATVCCVDGTLMPDSGVAEPASKKVAELQFTVFQKAGGKNLAFLNASVGKTVSFFQLSYQQDSSGDFQVVSGQRFHCRPAQGEKADTLTARAAELQSLQSDSLSSVTKVWEGNYTAKDYVATPAMQTTSALLSTMLTPTMDVFEKETLWQVNYAELLAPAPGTDVWTNDKVRVWFPSVLRDFSGEVTVWVREKAALQLAGTEDTKAFSQAAVDGDLLFPVLSSVRVLRTLGQFSGAKDSEDGDSTGIAAASQVSLVVVEAMEQPWNHGPSNALTEIFHLLQQCPPSADCVLPASLGMLRKSPHYGLAVDYDTGALRPCLKALVLIRSKSKSKLENLGEKGHRLVTEAVEYGLLEA